ncbi:hypothetical protein [Corynebacterium bovis]|uniref:Uncharacterized protein n=2 Tax=Corynebacterium bovis TaxID=36808 RepID=A0A8H9Y7R5_9CORY|nr:hypothetical protein [Corynebacterium bovis]MBB3115615.1 hypothetical protein [Corynebacterium bovis DSM 20582 = CIP 54.80]QQC47325.1 hypothetical protein I6I09_09970 [Corynebacterium bovis]WJY77040.1 hypothetical protein CBOVI_02505 [Corynebacterium bovis DSM 20582 = CIP 54.80]
MNDGGWGRRPGEPRRPSDTAGGDASQWPAGPRDRTGGPEGARAPDPRSAGTTETDQTAQLDLRQWGAAGSSGAGGSQDAAGWQDDAGSTWAAGSGGWQDAAGSAGSAGWQDAPAAPAEPRRRRGGAVIAGVVVVLVAAVAGGLAAWQPWKTDPAGAAAPSPQFTTTPDRPTTDRSARDETPPTQRVPSAPTPGTPSPPRRETPTPRPVPPATPDPGPLPAGLTDHGWTGSPGASCNASDTWVFAARGSESQVVVCRVGDAGGLYYRGEFRGGQAEHDIAASGSGGTWWRTEPEGGMTITVTPDGLSVDRVDGGTVTTSSFTEHRQR